MPVAPGTSTSELRATHSASPPVSHLLEESPDQVLKPIGSFVLS